MNWKNDNGGPWGSGGNGNPWGKGSSGGDFEDTIKKAFSVKKALAVANKQ